MNNTLYDLEDAYLNLLLLPVTHPVRLRGQQTLCDLRDAISDITGDTPETTQTRFEILACKLSGDRARRMKA